MQRLLVGFIFSIALLATSTASALVMTSGKFDLRDYERRPESIILSVSDSIVNAPQIQVGRLHRFEWPRTPAPFEWPKFDRPREESDSWKGKFPFFSHFPLDFLGKLHHHRHDDSPGSTVPEPTTALLFGSGLLGLALVGRQRR